MYSNCWISITYYICTGIIILRTGYDIIVFMNYLLNWFLFVLKLIKW